jgi:hypothetical protein
MSDEEQTVSVPPHRRITNLTFSANDKLSLQLEGLGTSRSISPEQVKMLCGARYHYPSLPTERYETRAGISMLTASTWPRSLRPHTRIAAVVPEDIHFALGIRVVGVNELWYLITPSFNFHEALGACAGYATEENFKMLAKRLAAFARNARCDVFVTAVLAGKSTPPEVESLLAFIRTAPR